MFLQALFDFVIVAFAIFMIVKLGNSVRRKRGEAGCTGGTAAARGAVGGDPRSAEAPLIQPQEAQ